MSGVWQQPICPVLGFQTGDRDAAGGTNGTVCGRIGGVSGRAVELHFRRLRGRYETKGADSLIDRYRRRAHDASHWSIGSKPQWSRIKPNLRRAAERLDRLHTAEGVPLPPSTLAELRRDMARLRFVMEQIREIEAARQVRLEQHPEQASHAMVRLLAQVIGIGIETADMLVHEILSRELRDRKPVARYAGLTGSPDESGARRREKGLARAGNARVRRGMIQLAWLFLNVPEGKRAGPMVPNADGR
jgi:transposase